MSVPKSKKPNPTRLQDDLSSLVKYAEREALQSVCGTISTAARPESTIRRLKEECTYDVLSSVSKPTALIAEEIEGFLSQLRGYSRQVKVRSTFPLPGDIANSPSGIHSKKTCQSSEMCAREMADLQTRAKSYSLANKLVSLDNTFLKQEILSSPVPTQGESPSPMKVSFNKALPPLSQQKASPTSHFGEESSKDELDSFLEDEEHRRRVKMRKMTLHQIECLSMFTPRAKEESIIARAEVSHHKRQSVKEKYYSSLIEHEKKKIESAEAVERQHEEFMRKKAAGEKCLRTLQWTAIVLALRLVRTAAIISFDSQRSAHNIMSNRHMALSLSQLLDRRKVQFNKNAPPQLNLPVMDANKDAVFRRRLEKIATSVKIVMRTVRRWIVMRHPQIRSRQSAAKLVKSFLETLKRQRILALQANIRSWRRQLKLVRSVFRTAKFRNQLQENMALKQWFVITKDKPLCPPSLQLEIIRHELNKKRSKFNEKQSIQQLRQMEKFPQVPVLIDGNRVLRLDPTPLFTETHGFDANGNQLTKYAPNTSTQLSRYMVLHHAKKFVTLIGNFHKRRLDPRHSMNELKYVSVPTKDAFVPLLDPIHLEKVIKYAASSWDLTLAGTQASKDLFFRGLP